MNKRQAKKRDKMLYSMSRADADKMRMLMREYLDPKKVQDSFSVIARRK